MHYIKSRGVSQYAITSYIFIALLVFATGCAGYKKGAKAPAHVVETHWGYEGEAGPEAWGELSPDFALCSNGMNQSPIDISGAAKKNLTDIVFDYRLTTLDILNNGHTIQVNYDKGSSIVIDGTGRYKLKQFHFHAPSEHTVNGKHFAMEMHLVHQSDDGELAVVGVLIEDGIYNWSFIPVWDNLPAGSGEEHHLNNVMVNVKDLLPGNRLYYRYDGSLTTPPCTEGVKWFVLTTPIKLSESQVASFKAIVHNNNRPVQPLNNREVLMDASTD
ncbi:MAG: carbonic anhydrase [Candidatus Brocadiales bacterium]